MTCTVSRGFSNNAHVFRRCQAACGLVVPGPAGCAVLLRGVRLEDVTTVNDCVDD